MKKLKGTMRLSRVTTNTRDDYIAVELTDDGSGCRAVTAEVELSEFANLMTNHLAECVFHWNDSGNVGLLREWKEERVEVPSIDGSDDEYRAALKPFEVDGWKGNIGRAKNHRYRTYNGDRCFADVVFERYMEATDAKD